MQVNIGSGNMPRLGKMQKDRGLHLFFK
jgi:hypothetical protein